MKLAGWIVMVVLSTLIVLGGLGMIRFAVDAWETGSAALIVLQGTLYVAYCAGSTVLWFLALDASREHR